MTTTGASAKPALALFDLAAEVEELGGELAGATAFEYLALLLATARYAPEWVIAAWHQVVVLLAETESATIEMVAAEYALKVEALIEAFPARGTG